MHQSHRIHFVPTDTDYEPIADLIFEEAHRAAAKWPGWPTDLVHSDAIINEENGEATRALLQTVYEGKSLGEYRKELVQTGAMVFRQLAFLEKYYPEKGLFESFDPVLHD